MGFGGRWEIVVLVLGATLVAAEAHAGDGGPLLSFDESAAALPKEEIRAGIERELGKPLATTSEGASGEIVVLVDAEGRLVVRYRAERGSVDRYLPMPSEPADIPLIIALAAGNLARDQSVGVSGSPATLAPFPETAVVVAPVSAPPERGDASGAAPVASREPLKRHWIGFHVAKDIAWIGGSNVCDVNLGQQFDNYACFYEDTDHPFWHTPFPYEDGIETGLVLATTRILASYDYAISKFATVGARVGFAFGGGPPAGQGPAAPFDSAENPNEIPDHTEGTGGTAFMPLHAEVRGALWPVPLTAKPLSAYVGMGFGVAQVDAKTTIDQRDCADTLQQDWDATNGNFSQCRNGDSSFDWRELEPTPVDAWKKLGQAFVSVSVGGLWHLTDEAGFLLNLNAMYTFPSPGIVFEPSIGVVAGL